MSPKVFFFWAYKFVWTRKLKTLCRDAIWDLLVATMSTINAIVHFFFLLCRLKMACYGNHSRATKGNKIEKKCTWQEFCSDFIRLQSSWVKNEIYSLLLSFCNYCLKIYHVNFHRTPTSFGWVVKRRLAKPSAIVRSNTHETSFKSHSQNTFFNFFSLYFYPLDFIETTLLFIAIFCIRPYGEFVFLHNAVENRLDTLWGQSYQVQFDSCYWWFLLAWKAMLPKWEGQKVQCEVYAAPNVRWSNRLTVVPAGKASSV